MISIDWFYKFFFLGTSKVIRADRGTENVNIALLQQFYRINGSDSLAGEKSFQYGRSTANQVRYWVWDIKQKKRAQENMEALIFLIFTEDATVKYFKNVFFTHVTLEISKILFFALRKSVHAKN